MNIGHAPGLHQLLRVQRGLIVGIAVQHHASAEVANRLYFYQRSGARHHNSRLHAQLASCHCNTLRVIASRSGNHSAIALCLTEPAHLAVGSAQFKGEHGLQILTLQPDRPVKAR